MAGLQIGEVARRTGVTTATVRYYEREGLLPKPPRSAGGYRLYSARAVEELVFVRRAQGIGFSLEEIRELLRLSRNGTAPCSRVLALAEEHLGAVERRIRELQTFRKGLASAVQRWRGGHCSFAPGGLCDLIGTPATAPAVLPHPTRETSRRASGRPASRTPW